VTGEFIFFLIILLFVAAFLHGDFAFTLLYLFVGAYLLGSLWNRTAINRLKIKRSFEPRAFLGEYIPVKVHIVNSGFLPVVWLRIYESTSSTLARARTIKEIVSLPPRGKTEVAYSLHARKRGRYAIGPLFASSNDLLGLSSEYQIEDLPEDLIVYPNIIPLGNIKLPSRSPLGTLRHHQPIFEDPSRVLSKRDYIAGDSLRRVDWKASAAVGRLQVKQFEPSIALETVIFLNLNGSEYSSHNRIDSTELGIVIAASLASWVVSQKQSVGLVTNGSDPVKKEDRAIKPLPPRKGRGHMINILDVLARIQLSNQLPFVPLIRRQCSYLAWGTTLVLITGQADEGLFDVLFHARRRGQDAVIILAGRGSNVQAARLRARSFGFPLFAFRNEAEVYNWNRLE
jgi:uncharacterized protein (DUF58 family)